MLKVSINPLVNLGIKILKKTAFVAESLYGFVFLFFKKNKNDYKIFIN